MTPKSRIAQPKINKNEVPKRVGLTKATKPMSIVIQGVIQKNGPIFANFDACAKLIY